MESDDEEDGLGFKHHSGDEAEDSGDDANLAELIDDTERSKALDAAGDEAAEAQFMKDKDADYDEQLKLARNIADGKFRGRRRNGQVIDDNSSDDDWDDIHTQHLPKKRKTNAESGKLSELCQSVHSS